MNPVEEPTGLAAGDRSDMVEIFNEQLERTRAKFDKANATDFIPLGDAALINHYRNDFQRNIESLLGSGFFTLTKDREDAESIVAEYEALTLDREKLEIKVKKVVEEETSIPDSE